MALAKSPGVRTGRFSTAVIIWPALRPAASAEEAGFHLLALLEYLAGVAAHGVEGDGVAGPGVEPGDVGRVGGQADQLPPEVDHSPAAHAEVQLGVDLQQGRIVVELEDVLELF